MRILTLEKAVGHKARIQKPFDFILTVAWSCRYDLQVQGDPTINKELTKYNPHLVTAFGALNF